jgi:transcriptional repressor NrdR
VDEVENRLAENPDRELAATEIGEMLAQRLASLDKIAYVRFASVYRDFQDVEAFLNEVTGLIRQKRSES